MRIARRSRIFFEGRGGEARLEWSWRLAKVDVQLEREAPKGWTYHVVVEEEGLTTEHEVSLAWVDHDHWCGGRRPPSQVVEAVVNYVIDHGGPKPLPARFDAARARWWIPRLDEELKMAL